MEISAQMIEEQVKGITQLMSTAEVQLASQGRVDIAGTLAAGRHMIQLLWNAIKPPAAQPQPIDFEEKAPPTP